VLIADTNNQRIRRVDFSTGVITTVAGTGTLGLSGDGGPATSAALYSPNNLAVDNNGNIFVACAQDVRQVDASGNITTLAGGLRNPDGVAVDGGGNVLIADFGNHRILQVAAGTGIISTLVGQGADNVLLDVSGNLFDWQSFEPNGVALDTNGNLFIAETNAHRVRKVTNLLPAQAPSGGRRRKNKKSRGLRKSRRAKKSRALRKSRK